jgi:hypothetical protein
MCETWCSDIAVIWLGPSAGHQAHPHITFRDLSGSVSFARRLWLKSVEWRVYASVEVFISSRAGGESLLSSTITSSLGIGLMHCSVILRDCLISSTRTRYLLSRVTEIITSSTDQSPSWEADTQVIKNSAFCGIQSSWPCSKKPTTGPSLGPNKSTLYP